MSRHLADDGGPIQFKVKRGSAEKMIDVTPVASKSMSSVGSIGLLAIDSIGIAVSVSDRVANISPNSKLNQAGVKEGDQIVSVKYMLSEAAQKEKWFRKLHGKVVEMSNTSPAEVFQVMQKLPEGTEFEVVFKSGDVEKTVTIKSNPSAEHFLAMRGFELKGLESHYQSETWSDAFSNGGRQVLNDASRVWRFLKKLVAVPDTVKCEPCDRELPADSRT